MEFCREEGDLFKTRDPCLEGWRTGVPLLAGTEKKRESEDGAKGDETESGDWLNVGRGGESVRTLRLFLGPCGRGRH